MQDGGSLDQVLKEAKRIPEDILGKVSIAVSLLAAAPSWEDKQSRSHPLEVLCQSHHGLWSVSTLLSSLYKNDCSGPEHYGVHSPSTQETGQVDLSAGVAWSAW